MFELNPAFPVRDPTFFFDFIDPGSYLVSVVIDEAGSAASLDWRGFEVRVPPAPLIAPGSGEWGAHQSRVSTYAEALEVPMTTPLFVPWTRKAHELVEFARVKNRYGRIRRALFRAHFVDGTDIGRIDLLVEIARQEGLDGSEAKVALDVDRYTATVLSNRAMARERNISGVPTLARGNHRLEGLRSPGEIERWIEVAEPSRRPTDSRPAEE